MASTIDALLARARLHDAAYPPADIADLTRTPDRGPDRAPAERTTAEVAPAGGPAAPAADRQRAMRGAADDLQALCETAVTGTAVSALGGGFLTQTLPQPSGARVLGCILLLTDAEDSARFWWQYAAGAGDPIATHCLYLHHLALGENRQAVWWRRQTARAEGAGLPAVLRTPRADGRERGRGRATVDAVMEYVSAAVRYVDDDLELPLPAPDFSERIRAITAAGGPSA
ncbi:hypothetical protein ACFVGY_07095 [Streptomyces sp. NPDC127106]|uniref:hypothetical protein n=1 Tax=Streptomyces sp. NPDC127106 TaxID=3345360 RepID=UPI0036444564